MRLLKRIAPRHLVGLYRRARNGRDAIPPVGTVRFGSLRRQRPFSRWGFTRGLPVDRYYIESFLAEHSGVIAGRVLEFGDPDYTRRFGRDRVLRSDVLHVVDGNPAATIVADVTEPGALPTDTFDAIICTQTLQQILDVRSAITNLYEALRPGGVLLATVPGISQIDRAAMNRWGDFWRFTTLSADRLFSAVFPKDEVVVTAYGNVLASTAFLYGVAADELSTAELEHRDPDYELLIGIRARKPLH